MASLLRLILKNAKHENPYFKVWAEEWAEDTFEEWFEFWSEKQEQYNFPDLPPPRAGKSENPETHPLPSKLELAEPEVKEEKGELLSLDETAEPRACKSEPETEPPSPHCPQIRPREESEEEDDEEEELPAKRPRVCKPEPVPEPIVQKPEKRPREEHKELMAIEARKMRKIMGDLTKLAADTFLYFAGRKHEEQPPQENTENSDSEDDEPSFNLAKSTLVDSEGYEHELDLSSDSDN